MKKTITLLCAFVLAISLNSCSSSDDSGGGSGADKVIGTWKYVGDMYAGEFFPDESESCDQELLKFASNHTGKFIDKYCDEPDDVETFTWEKTSDPVYNYVTTDEFGDAYPGIIKFSADFQQFTAYETEEDMLNEDGGEVFQKQ